MVTYAQHFKGGATLIHALYTIDEVYEDEKVDWDDAGTIASFIAWEAVLWGTDFLEWREIHKKPLYIIEAAIIAGGFISYGIGGREGLMNYVDLMTGKVTPKEWLEVVGPAIQSEVTEPIIEYLTEELWQKQLVDPIGGWVSRREKDIRRAWQLSAPFRINRYLTGPSLPF